MPWVPHFSFQINDLAWFLETIVDFCFCVIRIKLTPTNSFMCKYGICGTRMNRQVYLLFLQHEVVPHLFMAEAKQGHRFIVCIFDRV